MFNFCITFLYIFISLRYSLIVCSAYKIARPSIMSNHTSYSNTTSGAILGEDWDTSMAISHAFNTIALICATYMAVCVILYGTFEKLWNLSTQRGKLYAVCTTTACLTVIRLLIDQVYFHLHENLEVLDKCELLFDISNSSCSPALLSAYIFLWIKQWLIYSHEAIHRFASMRIRILSWFSLGIIIVTCIVFTGIFVIPPAYESDGKYCVSIEILNLPPQFQTLAVAKKYILGGLIVLVQGLLLFLFIYPMARTRMANTDPSNSDRKNDVIREIMRRSLISTIIAVTSDSLVLVILGVLPWRAPLIMSNLVYNISIVINLGCIIHSFRRPSDILLVCTKRRSDFSDSPKIATTRLTSTT